MSSQAVRAAVLRHTGAARPYPVSAPLAIETVSLAPPGSMEVAVRITAAGLCHSDLSVIEGSRPRPLPMLLGHEATGEVVELGAGVHDLALGDHVVFAFVPSCGHCLPCMTGRPPLCEAGAHANSTGTLLGGGIRLRDAHGTPVYHHLGVSAFAEYAVVSRRSLVRIDRTVAPEVAALFGCAVMTGVGAIANTARVRLGETVLITGLGGIGFAALLGALAAGASTVVVADINEQKLAQASALGAHLTVQVNAPTALEMVQDATHGGADIGLECAGVVSALDFTYRATKRGGRTVTVGLPHPDQRLALAPVQLVAEERALLGSYLGSSVPARDIPAYLALYQTGRLPVDRLLTHVMTLDDINHGFERMAQGNAIRQIIRF
ncbi:zinc-dependent alcohol dehydrogenase family protein [Gemmatimonas phototrophica]|uniref:Alcohol dehydrogenase n=1 Tax=Gemmatimonas phototrophica TaxID=1379270 RepID=A0A143BL60_9BACT|nr:zinc-dependent alcohol dehydrogenase family protein [Gemmatimonas phototrophica]AMW05776.1 alcohol dehydrogenase [Gemmatimonas phototrophica]